MNPRLRRDLTIAAVLLVVLAVTLCARPVEAQGYVQHDWIQANPAYVDRGGVHCCGANHDCHPVTPADLTEDESGVGYKGQRLSYGERGVYWVREPDPPAGMRPWVCVRHGRFVCAFRPQPGS